ncbi:MULTISPECIES: tRNA (adenosine(37)-N6)-dimethylallyltransferase MiaA [Methylosinus]|uniref:tRNA dimethylallyltransferase n=1 Tax=Methylosinus trichosporium (strain ATCC 35070 / NCIMB 11131 / UNIQEM 75 / OB3b) TaxID=595536 RepID=A0A2D2D3T6_METT3|nr:MULTISPECIES: tRNA (adenosine(37)-N6)-dimethylallyltransferase MiaA [Methylosinus]ATQ69662.1 tRNA (adenosine(37)-N6)-dimethylallyltransferase MiaA [Methylosinus trichosporium OB3b]OBS51250.1 tRNA (adenosine(37)-N6)-dimethylallyltransferase MiaA [Methylosinus sp. 3S-1]
MRRSILIAGPTASGKSALALAIAQRIGGVIVNADSMQVYRDLRILTARPTPEEEGRVRHLLFGHVDAGVNYSVGRWLEDFRRVLDELEREGATPIVAGGTGMYFKAALYGLSDIPPVPDSIREKIRAEAQGRAPEFLHARLAERDPETAARLRPTDPQRILRALEVLEATGRPLASFHNARSAPLLDAAACLAFFLAPPRDALHARIDARFDAMLRQGALDEVRALGARALDPALPAMRAHGAPHLMRFMRGEMSLEAAAAQGKLDTRHYSKRQFTFARHQLPSFRWIDAGETEAATLAAARFCASS